MWLGRSVIRSGIVAFWAVWFLIVFASNACDGLQSLGLVPADWPFASGNFAYVQAATARYSRAQAIPGLLFLGVIIWEAAAAVLFCRAAVLIRRKSEQSERAVHSAFAVGLALWAAFALADEIFIQYAIEAAHFRLFIAQLVSLLYMDLVPADR